MTSPILISECKPRQCSKRSLHKIFQIFCGVILGSGMAVLRPRYPVLSSIMMYSQTHTVNATFSLLFLVLAALTISKLTPSAVRYQCKKYTVLVFCYLIANNGALVRRHLPQGNIYPEIHLGCVQSVMSEWVKCNLICVYCLCRTLMLHILCTLTWHDVQRWSILKLKHTRIQGMFPKCVFSFCRQALYRGCRDMRARMPRSPVPLTTTLGMGRDLSNTLQPTESTLTMVLSTWTMMSGLQNTWTHHQDHFYKML